MFRLWPAIATQFRRILHGACFSQNSRPVPEDACWFHFERSRVAFRSTGICFAVFLQSLLHLASHQTSLFPLYDVMLRSILASAFVAQASAVWLAGLNIAGCEIGIDTSVSGQQSSQRK